MRVFGGRQASQYHYALSQGGSRINLSLVIIIPHSTIYKLELSFLPVAVLPVLPGDEAAVEDGGEVVGAALLPAPDTFSLLGLALTSLDVHTGLVTQHQLGFV